MLNISEESLAIADRFFYAIEYLIQHDRIKGLSSFTRAHNINYGNMNTLKNNRTIRSLKTEYLAFLAKDYGVSCRWLLLGDGEMFSQTPSKNGVSQNP